MHQAPAVRVRCPGSPGWCAARSGLAGGATLVIAGWVLLLADVPPQWAWPAAALAGVVMAVAVRHALLREPAWLLGWDGSRWRLASDAASVAVEVQTMDVMIDLDRWLLLRAQLIGGGSRWLAVGWERPCVAERKALCTALYAQRSVTIAPTLPDRPPR